MRYIVLALLFVGCGTGAGVEAGGAVLSDYIGTPVCLGSCWAETTKGYGAEKVYLRVRTECLSGEESSLFCYSDSAEQDCMDENGNFGHRVVVDDIGLSVDGDLWTFCEGEE